MPPMAHVTAPESTDVAERRQTVVILLESALGSSERPEDGKRVKRLRGLGLPELLTELTVLERSPGLPASSHRAIALAKLVLQGFDDRMTEFERVAWDIAGFMPLT